MYLSFQRVIKTSIAQPRGSVLSTLELLILSANSNTGWKSSPPTIYSGLIVDTKYQLKWLFDRGAFKICIYVSHRASKSIAVSNNQQTMQIDSIVPGRPVFNFGVSRIFSTLEFTLDEIVFWKMKLILKANKRWRVELIQLHFSYSAAQSASA